MQEETNVFTAKTVDEAIDEGLKTLGITLADAEIEILEEGKKKLIGSVKAKVRITVQGKTETKPEVEVKAKQPAPKKEKIVAKAEKPALKKTETEDAAADAVRALEFVNELLKVLELNGEAKIVSEGETIVINIETAESAKVIGKHGDVLDAIQSMAGAIANKDRDEYKKVIVDCENYRTQREETLVLLAHKIAKKATETGRKVILEPMSPYERRIIHATLSDNPDVKTISEGNEPARYIAVIPNGAKPGDRGIRFGGGDRRGNGRREGRGGRERNFGDRRRRDDRRDSGRSDSRPPRSSGGASRAKREIHFGTFLGNSKTMNGENTDKKED